jgi:YVTN family beta-propeller protein
MRSMVVRKLGQSPSPTRFACNTLSRCYDPMKNRIARFRSPILMALLVAAGTWTVVSPCAAANKYLGPNAVLAAKDGKGLYVALLDARQIAVVDLGAAKVARSIPLPAEPSGMVLSPDGATLYVTCAAPQSTVCAIDAAAGQVKFTLLAGHTAIGPAVTPDGKQLYVCNRFNNDVSVFDLEAKKEIARVPATREPYAAAVTPDGKSVFVVNHLPADRADSYDVAALVTVIDTETNKPASIRLPNGSSSVRGVCVSPDGKYVYVTHILARYQMPTTQLERGWMNTNALSILDAAAKKPINTALLDNVDLGAANPWGVSTTADGAAICVSHAGTHELSVIDSAGLLRKLAALPTDPKAVKPGDSSLYSSTVAADVPNDLAFLVDLRRRINLPGKGPRGLAVIGSTAYVAEYFTDTLAAVDLVGKGPGAIRQIALGPKPQPSAQRRGEALFHDATICFQHWQSCASCHPDARVDGLNWDLMNDGLGNPKNVKSMLLVHKTPPAMSEAVRETGEEAVRSGLRHILFAVRPDEEASAIDEYLKSLRPVPSPHLVDGKPSPAAERGRKVFFDPEVGCAKCHPEPLYTDLQMRDVGSHGQFDQRDDFDTPTLIEVWRTAPYMHDGHYLTIKELLTAGKHVAKGTKLEKLTPQQLDDLVEFVLSL